MRTLVFVTVFVAVMVVSTSVPTYATESYTFGEVSLTQDFRFNNDNWFIMPHPKVISFSVQEDGSAFGMTETGIVFSQYNIPNTAGIRIQRFEIQDHYHYIVEGDPVYSFTEFSARLANAYAESDAT